jgi:membrane-bound lytic murein transglycosylase A
MGFNFSLKLLTGVFVILSLGACSTLPEDTSNSGPFSDEIVNEPIEIIIAEPLDLPPVRQEVPPPRQTTPPPPEEPIIEEPLWYDNLKGWMEADHMSALQSFRRTCQSWKKADPEAPLNENLPQYGNYIDWLPACDGAFSLDETKMSAREFFEAEFSPLSLSTATDKEGLLTGYYEPEINVRLMPDAVYSAPILAKPEKEAVLKLPRSMISASSSRVIAYGRPIDVFFMQIQGSGRMKYGNGLTLRAAYAANNGQPYKSIGRILVERGEMTLSQASKQAIEYWMAKNGPEKTRELMNENPRYIYFKEQNIAQGEGPNGAMQVPLTDMGSLAVDPRYHPYGSLVWLDTILPQEPGDYKGAPAQLLVSAQDTGSAIKGPLRGDLFFGAGKIAGDTAGVMKHPVRWTILVPNGISPSDLPVS